jgi:hypothetical protein
MTQERLVLLGRIDEKRREKNELNYKIQAVRDRVRMCLDKWLPIEELRAEEAASLAIELAAMRRLYIELVEDLEAMKKDAGVA